MELKQSCNVVYVCIVLKIVSSINYKANEECSHFLSSRLFCFQKEYSKFFIKENFLKL